MGKKHAVDFSGLSSTKVVTKVTDDETKEARAAEAAAKEAEIAAQAKADRLAERKAREATKAKEAESATAATKTPAVDDTLKQDILELLGIAERMYHLPGGSNGNGTTGRLCLRVRERFGLPPGTPNPRKPKKGQA